MKNHEKLVLVQDPGDSSNRKFVIRCELAETESLLAMAKRHCPKADYEIEKALARGSNLMMRAIWSV